MGEIKLDTKVSQLNRVGEATSSKLKKLGIEIASDLIFYYPHRYDDFSVTTNISELKPGLITTVVGELESIKSRQTRYKRKSLTEGIVGDETGSIKVVWFNQPWISDNLKTGDEISLSGKVVGDDKNMYLNSPQYERVASSGIHTGRIVPIYPLTSGISQKQLRFLISNVINLAKDIKDYIPESIIKNQSLLNLNLAINKIHFADSKYDIEDARKRLAFDEIFLIQLWSKLLRQDLNNHKSYKIKFFEDKTKEFVSSLDFQLTNDQRKSAWEALSDMKSGLPMNRLIEGDVGSGKTVVSALAMYNTSLNKMQSAFLAPTSILAYQHYQTLSKLFNKLVRVGLLTRSQRIVEGGSVSKKEFLETCKKGEIDIIVGTHAIIQKEIEFKNLALVIVDEQHRFGVSQREALKQKSKNIPHFLSLTATPIPRSLALTVYGDLDLSIIKQMPQGRKKIITKVISLNKRSSTYKFINSQVDDGRQVFVICPLIDPSDKLGVRSVTEEFEKLDKSVFPDITIGLLHGRLKPAEKERVMSDFVSGKIKILVSTSVIEVGVDVKNATVMMIEDSDRFGLAQLHQFRGRVGRDKYQSYCFLFSDSKDKRTLERLSVMSKCSDGFELAQRDLNYRGAGQIYGYEQSGFSNFKMASLDDLELAKSASVSASEFMDNYSLDEFPELKKRLDNMNLNSHLE
jgi:ATP-dependent DNA helicase RecG